MKHYLIIIAILLLVYIVSCGNKNEHYDNQQNTLLSPINHNDDDRKNYPVNKINHENNKNTYKQQNTLLSPINNNSYIVRTTNGVTDRERNYIKMNENDTIELKFNPNLLPHIISYGAGDKWINKYVLTEGENTRFMDYLQRLSTTPKEKRHLLVDPGYIKKNIECSNKYFDGVDPNPGVNKSCYINMDVIKI